MEQYLNQAVGTWLTFGRLYIIVCVIFVFGCVLSWFVWKQCWKRNCVYDGTQTKQCLDCKWKLSGILNNRCLYCRKFISNAKRPNLYEREEKEDETCS